MARFSIPIHGYGSSDPKYANTACFVDYVRSLKAALEDLGHEVVPPTLDGNNLNHSARPIVFGAQNLHSLDVPGNPDSFIVKDSILYNTEQTGAAGWRNSNPRQIFDAVKTWRDRVVWDYSEVNAEVLRKMGCERVVMCPVGYHPSMTRIEPLPPEEEDIDVLFYGSVESPQRIAGLRKAGIGVMDRGEILAKLRAAGLRVEHVFGVYSTDLDSYVRRAKVVLNLHYYEGAVFEIFRCSHLFANKKCIATEDGGCDPVLEGFAQIATSYATRRSIVDVCKGYVQNADLRRESAEIGFQAFKKTSMVENVRRALEQS